MLAALGTALALQAGLARAGDPLVQLYSQTEKGRVSVGGTRLETLPGGFDPNDFDMPNGTDRWSRVVVEGSERYLLRIDGLLELNGGLLHELPFEIETVTPIWRELDVLDGTVAALRTDGLLTVDGVEIADFGIEGKTLIFNDVLLVDTGAATPTVFSLRNDGHVWRDGEADPLYELQAPNSTFGFNEGNSSDTQWVALAYSSSSGLVLALRSDGQVRSLDPAGPPPPPPPGSEDELPPEAGEPVAELPFLKKKNKQQFGLRQLYAHFECTESGLFRALRNDGKIYGTEALEEPLVDLPGKGNRRSQRYTALAVQGEQHYVLRRDGAVFAGTSEQPLLWVERRAVGLAASLALPDLSAADSNAPELSRVRAPAVAGQPAELPVLVADVDTDDDLLAVSVDLAELPGASFDAGTRLISWPAAGAPGKYEVPVSVDDGLFVEQRVLSIKVAPADTKPANRAPLLACYHPVLALVGRELRLPVIVADRDGDPLTVTLLPGDAADAGASYDELTGELRWTPALGDVGRTSARLSVSDGQATRTLRVRLDVRAALIDVGGLP